jgi:hypothetical protein
MSLILSGTDGLSDVDGSAATPAIRGTDANTGIFFPAADTIGFAEGGAEVMRIDSSGNVGIGVTPSAWVSTWTALQVKNASIAGFSNRMYVNANSYFDGSNNRYIATDFATRYYQVNGIHAWEAAPSGTAGNAITFTQVLAVEKAKSLALEGATSVSGTGISFPATQSASTNANTLDDYEEGTWTPTLSGTGGATGQSYSIQNGKYTKIGTVVTVSFDVRLSTLGTISGQAVIGGLPFSANGENCGIPIGTFENLGQSIIYLGARLQGGQSYITVFTTTAAASTTGDPNGSTLYTATSKLFGGGSYITS